MLISLDPALALLKCTDLVCFQVDMEILCNKKKLIDISPVDVHINNSLCCF